MKKIVTYAIIILICLNFCGCVPHKISKPKAEDNFEEYEKEITDYVAQYGYELSVENDDETEGYMNKDIYIVINDNESITVYLEFSYDKNKGVEDFWMTYDMLKQESLDDYDIGFYVGLVNLISGRELSLDFCKDFLYASEDEYPASRYNYNKLNGEKIAKMQALNFWEDWDISYTLYKEDNSELEFGGWTKNM